MSTIDSVVFFRHLCHHKTVTNIAHVFFDLVTQMSQRKKTLEKIELNKIRQCMPRGWQKRVARDAGKSISTVNKVMLRLRNNGYVVTKAIDLCGLPENEKEILKSKLLFIYELN